MKNFSQTTTHPIFTKKEKENSKKMRLFLKYEYLMKEAKKSKDDYLLCKSKNPLNLDEKNKIALAELIVIFRADALDWWNKSEDLITEYPFINEMIKLKK
tara:strand:- start:261 stop:560 length:300 start_codon:yes stop_codon:yes gene_type:complete